MKSPLRPVFVLNTVDERDGGPPAGIIAVATQMAIEGHSPLILTIERKGDQVIHSLRPAEKAGVRVQRIRFTPFLTSAMIALALHKLRNETDIVSVHGFYSFHIPGIALVCRFANLPYTIQPHGQLGRVDHSKHTGRKALFRVGGGSLVIRGAARVIVASRAEHDDLIAMANRLPSSVVGITTQVKNRSIGTLKPTTKTPAALVFLGRIHPVKHLELVFRVLKELDSTTTINILGDGDPTYIASLRKLTQHLGVEQRVRWHGHVSGDKKLDLLAQSDLLMVLSRNENFSVAVIEAAAVGVPAFVTESVGIAERLEHCGAGFVTRKTDAFSIATELRCFLEAIPGLDSAGRAAQEMVESEFSAPVVSARWLVAFSEVMTRKPRTRRG